MTEVAELSSRQAVGLIAGREVQVRIRSKGFLLTTAAFVAAVVLGGVLLKVFAGDETAHLGLTPAAAPVAGQIAATAEGAGLTVEIEDVADQAAGEQLLRSGDLDAVVTATSPQLSVVVEEQLDEGLAPLFGSLAQQLALVTAVTDLGGDPVAVAQDVAQATPDVTSLEPPPETDGAQIVAGYLAGVLLFLALVTAGQLVAQGVVEEKSSRVVELLLSTVRPWQLMAGKVLGIGIIGLLQVTAVIGAGAATATLLGLLDSSSLDVGSAAVWAVVWFVIGFATYALVLAALASLVSRQEDVAAVIAPVTALMVLPYVIGVSVAPWSPDSPVVVWLSYLPFCAPMVMPIRIALGAVEPWEIALSVGVSLAVIPLLVWLSGRIYSGAVLHTGDRLRIRQALARS